MRHTTTKRPRGLLAPTIHIFYSLASAEHRAEDVRVCAVIIAELKLRDIQRQILGTDLMECANNATFEDRPKAFNRVGVNSADHVLIAMMVNRPIQSYVSRPCVRRQQANLIRNGLLDEAKDAVTVNACQHAGDYIPLTLYCADDWRFVVAAMTPFLIPMPVLSLPPM
jgi:hypothetical protein